MLACKQFILICSYLFLFAIQKLPASERKEIESKMEKRHKATGELFEVLKV